MPAVTKAQDNKLAIAGPVYFLFKYQMILGNIGLILWVAVVKGYSCFILSLSPHKPQCMVYNVNTKYVFAYEVSPMSDRRCVKVLQNNLLAPPGTMERLVTQNNECILDVAFHIFYFLLLHPAD